MAVGVPVRIVAQVGGEDRGVLERRQQATTTGNVSSPAIESKQRNGSRDYVPSTVYSAASQFSRALFDRCTGTIAAAARPRSRRRCRSRVAAPDVRDCPTDRLRADRRVSSSGRSVANEALARSSRVGARRRDDRTASARAPLDRAQRDRRPCRTTSRARDDRACAGTSGRRGSRSCRARTARRRGGSARRCPRAGAAASSGDDDGHPKFAA